MPLNHDVIGVESDPVEKSWTSKDTLLYAVGVGAGLDDPLQELPFTTENSHGVEQLVLPTFAVLAAQGGGTRRSLGKFNPAMLVHAEQGFELHKPLPPSGSATVTSKVTGIWDKGSGALVTTESVAVGPDGERLVTSHSSVFIRGEGGFGGERGPSDDWKEPEREPDHRVTYQTRPEQALIYRLSGDRNPLHSDPKFAAMAGFDRPILHGLCTYGVTGRALLHAAAGSDPARFAGMYGRFSKPVFPGEPLTVSIWLDGESVLFRTTKADGTVVIDRGTATVRSADAN